MQTRAHPASSQDRPPSGPLLHQQGENPAGRRDGRAPAPCLASQRSSKGVRKEAGHAHPGHRHHQPGNCSGGRPNVVIRTKGETLT